jgi:hypothetical protein
MFADPIACTIRNNTSDRLRSACRARIVGVVLNNLVFSKRLVEPSVYGVVGALVGVATAAKFDHSVRNARGPTESDNKVLRVAPRTGISAIVLAVFETCQLAVVVLTNLEIQAGSSGVVQGLPEATAVTKASRVVDLILKELERGLWFRRQVWMMMDCENCK